MATPCNCARAALRAVKPAPTIRTGLSIPRRSFTSSYHSTTRSLAFEEQADSKLRTQFRIPLGMRNVEKRNIQIALSATRLFSSSAPRPKLKTIEQVKARNRGGPFNLTAAVLFVGTAGGLWAYFTYEKERMARKRIAEQTKGVGKPKVGGPFELVDQDGRPFTNEDLVGKYSLVYFGFTHCPDICPDELDKMALMYEKVKEKCGENVLVPLMITCDPARDKPAVLKEYLKEFHPAIIGLTGEYENIKNTCKAYRVYFSTPSNVKPGQDYLVDHSIYFYLMDPEGDFVEAIGRNFTADAAAKVISDHIKDWSGPLNKKDRWA